MHKLKSLPLLLVPGSFSLWDLREESIWIIDPGRVSGTGQGWSMDCNHSFESPLIVSKPSSVIVASVNNVTFTEENELRLLSQHNWQAMPPGFWICLVLWASFSSKCFLFTLDIFIWIIGIRKASRAHKTIFGSITSQGQGTGKLFAGFLMCRPSTVDS